MEKLKNDEQYHMNVSKGELYHQVYMIKKYVLKKIKKINCESAPFVNIKPVVKSLHKNKYHYLDKQKSKFFYTILKPKHTSKNSMESIWTK